ncbi:MAG TPA: ABC transporter permease [Candidatus Limnocylindria bacterium]|jgi:osmoprotectant transport system permease protein|nr:ABC transporter permease [Candidatus Limnocylindria bacterium]
MPDQPFLRLDWIVDNLDEIAFRTLQHLEITAIAMVIGFGLSMALALLARRWSVLRGPTIGISGMLYAIPSLAAFGLLIPFTGLGLLTAEIAMVSYTLLILIRNILAGLDGIAPEILEAADGMGLTAAQRLWRVELPLALPVIIAGLRIATVTTIGLVTVTSFIGEGGLGYFILNVGISRFFPTAIYVGALLSVALAVAADLAFVWLQRALTPWSRARATV